MDYKETEMSNAKNIFSTYGTPLHYEIGQMVMEKGAAAKQIWYIQSGIVRAYCTNSEGVEITLLFVGPGKIIGLESFASGSTFFNYGDAATPIDALSLPAETFLEIWQDCKYPLVEFIEQFTQKIFSLQDIICCSHYRDGNQKVAYFLYSQSHQSGPYIPYSNDQIAALTGINRVSVNRILNTFSKNGMIALGYRKIQVLKPDELKKVFNSVGYLIRD
ncbi:MAG: Crp/Fnr family transcriptional regulator [Oscillibacter sp.]|nr:Crp/Fnr family transcriptional regulator [Oscillibacter sp.]